MITTPMEDEMNDTSVTDTTRIPAEEVARLMAETDDEAVES